MWHTNLAERLDQEEDFKANQQLLERFSVTEAWKKMEKNLDKAMGRRAGERRWWKYAAVILVMLGGGFWYFQMKTAVPVKPPLKINFRKWKGGKACSERSVYFGRDGWYCDSKGFYGD